jgi:hypothetical protein
MTRDEAIEIEKSKLKKVRHLSTNYVNDMAEANIDALIELGLLKVDEPKKKVYVNFDFDHSFPIRITRHGKEVYRDD